MLWQARYLRAVLRLLDFLQPLASQAEFTFQKERPGDLWAKREHQKGGIDKKNDMSAGEAQPE
jgi:hypothetical protein